MTLAVFGITLALGRLWTAVLPQASLVDGAALGTWGGAAAGILLYELVHYWYHRAAHRWDWLWRLGHKMHHYGRGIHRYNYSDLPLWDMLFGTFRNPAAAETPLAAGFFRGASTRLGAMLAFRAVST